MDTKTHPNMFIYIYIYNINIKKDSSNFVVLFNIPTMHLGKKYKEHCFSLFELFYTSYRLVLSAYKSINIRCVKCQIFDIWHTKYHYSSLIHCSKYFKILKHATIPSQIWDGMESNAKFFYYLFIHQIFSNIYSLDFLSLSLLSYLFSLHLSSSLLPISPKLPNSPLILPKPPISPEP